MSVTIQWLKKWKPKNLISPCKTFVFSPPPFGFPYWFFPNQSPPPTQFFGQSLPSEMGRRNYGDSETMKISLCYCLLQVQISSSEKKNGSWHKILDFPRAKTFSKLSNRNRWNSPCLHQQWDESNPANIYLVKVNNKNTGNMYICKICSKLTIQTSERGRWRCSGVFIVNFEYISQLFLVFLLLTFDR